MLNKDINNFSSDEELDSEDEAEDNLDDVDDFYNKCDLEKAFDRLRMDRRLRKEEEEALIAFADRFTTCTLNPETAAKMIDESTSIKE